MRPYWYILSKYHWPEKIQTCSLIRKLQQYQLPITELLLTSEPSFSVSVHIKRQQIYLQCFNFHQAIAPSSTSHAVFYLKLNLIVITSNTLFAVVYNFLNQIGWTKGRQRWYSLCDRESEIVFISEKLRSKWKNPEEHGIHQVAFWNKTRE